MTPEERAQRLALESSVSGDWEDFLPRAAKTIREAVEAERARAVRLMRTHAVWCLGSEQDVPPHDAADCVESALEVNGT